MIPLRKVLLLWLLPVIDLAFQRRILAYYASIGIHIPRRHARTATLERLLGYLPVGFIISHFLGWLFAVFVLAVVMVVGGPIEIYMMRRAMFPWRFLRGVQSEVITPVALLEMYNCAGYFLLGVALRAF